MISASEAANRAQDARQARANQRADRERRVADTYTRPILEILYDRVGTTSGAGGMATSLAWDALLDEVAGRARARLDKPHDGLLRRHIVSALQVSGYRVEWRGDELWISWGPTGDAPQHDHSIK